MCVNLPPTWRTRCDIWTNDTFTQITQISSYTRYANHGTSRITNTYHISYGPSLIFRQVGQGGDLFIISEPDEKYLLWNLWEVYITYVRLFILVLFWTIWNKKCWQIWFILKSPLIFKLWILGMKDTKILKKFVSMYSKILWKF